MSSELPKIKKIMLTLDKPKRFTDIKLLTKLSDMGLTKDLKVLQKNGLIKNDKTTHLYEITDLGKIEVRKLYLYEKINNMTPDELARFEYLFEHVERIEKLGNKLTKEEMECLERGLAKVDLEDIMTEDEAQELSKALKTVSLSQ